MTEDIHDHPPYAVRCHSSPQQGHPSVPSLFLMFYLRNVGLSKMDDCHSITACICKACSVFIINGDDTCFFVFFERE